MTTTPSRTFAHVIEAFRPTFLGFARDQDTLFGKRAELAPTFASLFTRWRRETGRGLIALVRELDKSVPADRAAYVNHRSFQAAWYLVRTARAAKRPAGGTHRTTITPFALLATVIKSVQPVLHPHEARVFEQIVKASRWHQRDIDRLKKAVAAAKPLPLFPHLPRLVSRHSRNRELRAVASNR